MKFLDEILVPNIFWIAILFLCIYVYLKYYVYNYWKRHGVPHEEPSLPLGNIPVSYLFGKMSLGELIEDNCRNLRQHPFHGLYILNRPVIVINDPELIRLIFVKEFTKFCDRGWFINDKIDQLSGNIFLLHEEKWTFLRKKFSPTFTPGKLRQFHHLMAKVSDELIEAFDMEYKNSEIIEVKDLIARYSTDIISSVVYGLNSNSLKNPKTEFRYHGLKAFEFGSINLLIAIFLPEVLEKISLPFYQKESRDFFSRVFKETVEYRRKEKIDRHDFMDLLIQLMDIGKVEEDDATDANEVNKDSNTTKITMIDAMAQAFLFFLAGFETSSSTATFCLLELAMNPDVQQKLQEEIDRVAESSTGFTYDTIMGMEYLDQVFSETLRKYNSVTFLNRICMEDFKIPKSNFVIPKGMRVVVSSSSVHHNPLIYPDPEKFDPDRFAKENASSLNTYAQLGFGVGPRNCIGMRFGILQTKQAVAQVMYNYRIFISDKTHLPLKYDTQNFVMAPVEGVFLRFQKRQHLS